MCNQHIITYQNFEIILVVDGDDWIEPQMYEHLMGLAKAIQRNLLQLGFIESAYIVLILQMMWLGIFWYLRKM